MSYYDPTENTRNQFNIVFENITVKQSVEFKAFITNWNDEFKQDWQNHSTFGRMDDIRIFKRTSRKLNFDIDIPSASEQEADENFTSIQKLIQMSYPTFETNKTSGRNNSDSSQASDLIDAVQKDNYSQIFDQQRDIEKYKVSIMGSPPFMNIKFANWALQSGNSMGIYGTIDNVKFNPLFGSEAGFYSTNLINDEGYSPLTPKSLKLSISFNVIHVENLGYGLKKETVTRRGEVIGEREYMAPREPQFPYRSEYVSDKKHVSKEQQTKQVSEMMEEQKRNSQETLSSIFGGLSDKLSKLK